ncbi:MAG: hypothetical protein ACLQUY_11845 [Ktedonobacterales bacterium]
MINEPNSHNHHHQPEELEELEELLGADTWLLPEVEALAARLSADGALWQATLPDAGRVAERMRAIPYDSPHEAHLTAAAEASRGRIDEKTRSTPELMGPVRRAPYQVRPASFFQRLGSLAAVAIVLALVGSIALVFYAVHHPVASLQPTAQDHPTATPVPATSTPLPPTAPVITAPIDEIRMVSATVGWGRVHNTSGTYDSEIAYTVDGGHTWYNVTPPGLTPEPQGTIALYPRSATEAWTWLSLNAGGSSTTLWHTTDAGAHWASTTVATGAVRQLDFISATTGWLAATPLGAATGLYPIEVWRTTDGGATWTQVASYRVWAGTPGMSFANATTGIACSDADGGPLLLYITHDAGSTWSTLSLPTPPGYLEADATLAERPVFTSATAGVLEVSYGSGPSNPALFDVYRTTDAGTSWQLGASLSGVGGTSFVSSMLATGEVFAAAAVNGQVTLDQLPVGATSWTKITTDSSSTALLSGITQLNFVNPTIGWAVTTAGLLGTTDGGVTWTALHA